MWGYQHHFRTLLQHAIEPLLERAGARLSVTAVLVGILRPGEPNAEQSATQSGLPICIEPENGLLLEGDFDGLPEEIEQRVSLHPDQRISYGDEPRMRDKPERIRRKATYEAIQGRIQSNDARHGVISLIGTGTVIGRYHVFPILRFNATEWNQYNILSHSKTDTGYWLPRSFLEALAYRILSDATVELSHPDAGRYPVDTFGRDPADALRSAGKNLMYVAESAGGNIQGQGVLFEYCNLISSLKYEGSAGSGQMIVARQDHPDVITHLMLRQPILLRETGWARKVLQVASQELAILSDACKVRGLGQLSPRYRAESEDAFIVRFTGHYKWELVHNSRVLMRVEYGVPALPREPLDKSFFKTESIRIFGHIPSTDVDELWKIVLGATEQKHGTMIVVAANAADEAARLSMQATSIEPTKLSPDTIRRVTAIDGAVLLDQSGLCHAIGVILDGRASPNGTPSRGARYNSAVRYIESASSPVLAVVVSEDRTIDFLPKLPPQIPRNLISDLLNAAQRAASAKDWDELEQAIRHLSARRLYLNNEEVAIANGLLDQLLNRPREPMEIVLHYPRFEENPGLNNSYFI